MRKRTARQGDWQQHKEAISRSESAHNLYETMNKKPKAPVLVAKKRINHLQKDEWTDKVFTGDNPDTTAHLSQAAAERDTAIGQLVKGRTAKMDQIKTSLRDRLQPMRQSQSAARAAHIAADTLDGKVDLKHVADIRRQLRRMYASRSNLHKIFNQWDREKKGSISSQDIFMGLNKMGITTSLEQAMALQASGKQQDDDPNLSLQEFTELLFSNDEVFKVDLNKLTAPSTEQVEGVREF